MCMIKSCPADYETATIIIKSKKQKETYLVTEFDELEVTHKGKHFIVYGKDIRQFYNEGIREIDVDDLYDQILINRL